MLGKEERLRFLAAGTDELHAQLAHKSSFLHLFQQPEPLQRPIDFRHQRLADVKPRKHVSVDQQNGRPSFGHQCRYRAPGRSSAYHDHIVGILHRHSPQFRCLLSFRRHESIGL